MRQLIIASRNKGKLKEFKELLSALPFDVVSLEDYPEISPIEENGTTFTENAIIKAETVASFTGMLALADDSGLEVDSLSGRPGVLSARFAGPDADDDANNKKLLAELCHASSDARGARFRSVIAIAAPDMTTRVADGTCEGMITTQPRGEGGFGYDPLFYVESIGKTFAEMSPQEKNRISHRAKAMLKARIILEDILIGL